MKRAAALVALVIASCLGPVRPAAAETVEILDGSRPWRLDLPEGFDPEPLGELNDGVMLARFSDRRGRRVVVARVRGNTDGAYGGSRAFFDGLEEGLRRQTDGYRRLAAAHRKTGRRGRTPVYDVWYRAGRAVRGARFVLLKGYALVVTVHAPASRRVDRTLKKTLESFAPKT